MVVFLRLVFLLFILLPPIPGYTQWIVQDIDHADEIFAISSYGANSIAFGTEGGILVSQDAGTSFQFHRVEDGSGDLELYSAIFDLKLTGAESVFISGYFLSGTGQFIWHSVDNFDSWRVAHHYTTHNGGIHYVKDIEFANEIMGFAVGLNSSLLSTFDGGQNWITHLENEQSLNAISMHDALIGIAVGNELIYRTVDGIRWHSTPTDQYLEAVIMADEQTAYAGGEGGMIKTIDGGLSWEQIENAPRDINHLIIDDDNNIIAATFNGIYISRSEGRHWEVFEETIGYKINDVQKINDSWWAVGDKGIILRTNSLSNSIPIISLNPIYPPSPICDGANIQLKHTGDPNWSYEWYRNDSLFATTTYASIFAEENILDTIKLVVNTGSAIDTLQQEIRLSNVGETPEVELQTEYYGCTGNFFTLKLDQPEDVGRYSYEWFYAGDPQPFSNKATAEVNATADSQVLLVASHPSGCKDTTIINLNIDQDYITRNWKEVGRLPNSPKLSDIQFVNDMVGFASTFISCHKTIDGGKSWFPTNARGSKMSFISPQVGFITSSRLFQTNDGGKSFIQLPIPGVITGDANIRAHYVKFINDKVGFIVDKTGSNNVRKTKDGGRIWRQVLHINADVKAIDCPSDSICYLAAADAGLFRSDDQGESWVHLNGLGERPITDVVATDEETIYATSYAGVTKSVDGGINWVVQNVGELSSGRLAVTKNKEVYLNANNWLYNNSPEDEDCWQKQYNLTGGSLVGMSFPTEEVGFFARYGGETNVIYRYTPDVYFTLPLPLCLGDTARIDNDAILNGYNQFEWYINDTLFSHEETPQWIVEHSGDYQFKLVASNGEKVDSFSRVIHIDPLPEQLELEEYPITFCSDMDTLRIKDEDKRFGYNWSFSPSGAARINPLYNEVVITWDINAPYLYDSISVEAYAVSDNQCTGGDTLQATFPIHPTYQSFSFPNSNPRRICLSEEETKTATFAVSHIPDFIYEWEILEGDPNWVLAPDSSQVTVTLSHNSYYTRGVLGITGYNDCGVMVDSIIFDLIGPPEIIQQPQDLEALEGDEVRLGVEVLTAPNTTVHYDLYKNDSLMLTSIILPFKIENFQLDDQGEYFITAGNGCYESRTTPFTLGSVGIGRVEVFYDFNEDGIKSENEPYLNLGSVLVNSNNLAFPNQEGKINFYSLEEGTTVDINFQVPLNWKLTASSNLHQIILSSNEESIVRLGLIPLEEINKVESFINASPFVCNRDATFYIDVVNTGTTIQSPTIQFEGDVSLIPNVNNVFTIDSFFPGQSRQYSLTLLMPGVEQIGDDLIFKAITTVENPNGSDEVISNTFEYSSPLLCAYDPNDKLVMPLGKGETGLTPFGEYLNYTIRFQNTGNYPAEDVRITDTLDQRLDLKTFEFIAASHLVSKVSLKDNVVEFIFHNIYLPDSISNEPESHGFVSFRIQPYDNLDEGTQIKNKGHIYFDDNPAIVTNNTLNTLSNDVVSATSSEISPTQQVVISPNPSKGIINITCDNSIVGSFWGLFSSSGVMVENGFINKNEEQLNFNALPKGIYLLKIDQSWYKIILV